MAGATRIALYPADKAFLLTDNGKGLDSRRIHGADSLENGGFNDYQAFFNVGFSTKGRLTIPLMIERGYQGQGSKMLMSKVKSVG